MILATILAASLAFANAQYPLQPLNGADGFQYLLSYQTSVDVMDVGETAFNNVFWNSDNKILVRWCETCGTGDYDYIYYKRLTDTTSANIYSLTDSWLTTDADGYSNVLGQDFLLYSTLEDALTGTNPWTWCNYDDIGIGMFRDCGVTGYVPYQWTSRTRGGDTARFYVYTPEQINQCGNEGFGLSQSHFCGCVSSCENPTYCNTIEFVVDRLGDSLSMPSDELCYGDDVCCCHCPNCPEAVLE